MLEILSALKRRFGLNTSQVHTTAPSPSKPHSVLWLPDLSTPEQHALLKQLVGRSLTDAETKALASKADRCSPLFLRLLAPHIASVAEFPSSVPEVGGGRMAMCVHVLFVSVVVRGCVY